MSSMFFGKIVKKHDDNLNNCKADKNNGEPKQSFCKTSKCDRLIHKPIRLFRQILGLLSSFFGKLFLCLRNFNLSVRNYNKLSNFSCQSVNLLRQSNLSVCRLPKFFTDFAYVWHGLTEQPYFFDSFFRNLKFHNRN